MVYLGSFCITLQPLRTQFEFGAIAESDVYRMVQFGNKGEIGCLDFCSVFSSYFMV